MVDLELARSSCLKLPEVQEFDHFEKPAYRVKKKIFATLWLDEKRAVLKLSPTGQEYYCLEYASSFFPVKGTWGKFGWTYVDLSKISVPVFSKALLAAWLNVAPKLLAKKHGFGCLKPLTPRNCLSAISQGYLEQKLYLCGCLSKTG